MGNYKLVAIDAINEMNLDILLPVLIGAVVGLIAFSHLLSWVFKNYRNQTISLLTGFILGSVSILWPWKRTIYLLDEFGNKILKEGQAITLKYERILPQSFDLEFFFAIGFIIFGIISIWTIEAGAKKSKN